MSLVIHSGSPVTDGCIHIFPQKPEAAACGHGPGCGHHHHEAMPEGCAVQTDALVNMLYFAVFRQRCGVRLYDSDGGILEFNAEELKPLSGAIDQLSTIFGLKTGQLSLVQFAHEFRDQTVYYSTLVGDGPGGEPAFYACTQGDDGIEYYPVFLTEANLRTFMDQHNRPAYTVMCNTLSRFLSLLDANSYLKELGVVIEPLMSCSVGFPPGLRVE